MNEKEKRKTGGEGSFLSTWMKEGRMEGMNE